MRKGELLNIDTDKVWDYLDSPTKNTITCETEDASERSQFITTPPSRGGLIKLG